MKVTDAVLVALVAADGPVDKLELATGDENNARVTELAAYQTAGAAGDTHKTEDLKIMKWLSEYIMKKASRGGLASTDAVLASMVGADGLIDKLELATDVFNAAQVSYLANFQAEAASTLKASTAVPVCGSPTNLLLKYVQRKATP